VPDTFKGVRHLKIPEPHTNPLLIKERKNPKFKNYFPKFYAKILAWQKMEMGRKLTKLTK
jgi:hypothetical protein